MKQQPLPLQLTCFLAITADDINPLILCVSSSLRLYFLSNVNTSVDAANVFNTAVGLNAFLPKVLMIEPATSVMTPLNNCVINELIVPDLDVMILM